MTASHTLNLRLENGSVVADLLTEPRTDAAKASIPACSICDDTRVIHMDGRALPCPYCDPNAARKAAS
jgi:hypothetical protein